MSVKNAKNLTQQMSVVHSAFLLSLVLLCSLYLSAEIAYAQDIPVIERPVHLTNNSQYERPHLPVFRTTQDGRVGLNFEQGISFYLNAPEKFDVNFHESETWPYIMAHDAQRYSVDNIHNSSNRPTWHITMCEAPNTAGVIENPRACGGDDCYDVTMLTSAFVDSAETRVRLWGTPATIRISQPKTPNAYIRTVQFGTPKAGSTVFPIQELFEPMVTADGNLMMARISRTNDLTWHNRATGRNVTGEYDMVYFPAPQDPSMACNVDQWDEIKPLGHAPYDPEINQTYGFAMQPFRDSMGNILPDGTDLVGTYPWVDSKGDNIAFSSLNTSLVDDIFSYGCVPGVTCNDSNLNAFWEWESNNSRLMGKTIAGLWTNGKMVLLDNMLNNVDYDAVGTQDETHRMVNMYTPESKWDWGDGVVRIGNGRDDGAGNLYGWAGNTTFIESYENKLNYWEHLKPVTPRDVVWHMSTGAASDEFAFDDYLYPNGFIVSSMVQATSNDGTTLLQYNGANRPETYVQNGATSTDWNVPSHGNVVNGRIERVALGGIHGKGLWMSNNTYIDYGLGQQPTAIRNHDWHISLFVDARFNNDSSTRVLVAFPDGSELQLVGRDQVRYWRGSAFKTIDLPQAIPHTGWAHFGVQMSNGNRTAELYFDGYLLDRYTNSTPFFEMSVGNLYVGDNPARTVAGFRGWIDEFKVIAHNTGKESWCNHANGTLIGIPSMSGGWSDKANGYPAFAHQEITDFLGGFGKPTFPQYACYHDYWDDYGAYRANIPDGYHGVGEDFNFPEGPVYHDRPRPDSSNNTFCMKCHVSDGLQGLGLDALETQSMNAVDDPRRQPMQPNPLVFGNIPAGWLGDGKPAQSMVAPPEGVPIDLWLFQSKPENFVPMPAENVRDVSGTYTPPLTGDFNGDGYDDIFWYKPGSGGDSVWQGKSDGTFRPLGQFRDVSGTYTPLTGDFNGDGLDDIFWYKPGFGGDSVWQGKSDGTFHPSGQFRDVSGTYTPLTGDFNGDGSDDIFWYKPGPGGDSIWLGW